MLYLVSAAAVAAGVVLLVKRAFAAPPEPVSSSAPPPPPPALASDMPLAFLAFLMFLALFHWLGLSGGGSGAGFDDATAPHASYEDAMIGSIAEECLTGHCPF